MLGPATWTDLTEIAATSILLLPLGSTEQHGPHLPLSTDTDVAVAIADRASAQRSNLIVAPPVPYGSSGEHASFPGTLSIGQAALEHVAGELVRSADAFAAIVLVSGHGGNLEPLGRATTTLRAEGRRVELWSPSGYLDAHAGRTETSLTLALDPARVRLAEAQPGNNRPLAELLPTLRTVGVRAVSPNGVLGDPFGASAAEGHRLLDLLVADLLAIIDRMTPDA